MFNFQYSTPQCGMFHVQVRERINDYKTKKRSGERFFDGIVFFGVAVGLDEGCHE